MKSEEQQGRATKSDEKALSDETVMVFQLSHKNKIKFILRRASRCNIHHFELQCKERKPRSLKHHTTG